MNQEKIGSSPSEGHQIPPRTSKRARPPVAPILFDNIAPRAPILETKSDRAGMAIFKKRRHSPLTCQCARPGRGPPAAILLLLRPEASALLFGFNSEAVTIGLREKKETFRVRLGSPFRSFSSQPSHGMILILP
jgi:hypothetical protein